MPSEATSAKEGELTASHGWRVSLRAPPHRFFSHPIAEIIPAGHPTRSAMDIVQELRRIVGDTGVLTAAEVAERAAGVWRGDKQKALALVRPSTTEEVAQVLRWCHAHGVAVVTHGGLTGLVHGADVMQGELVLSLERMRAIES